MAKKVEVILLEDVEGLGEAGEIVSVAEGHARNVLFPVGAAALATQRDRQVQREKQSRQRRDDATRLQALQDQAAALEGTELVLQARVKDGNEIFGSITAAVIAKELAAQAKVVVKAKDVELEASITRLGTYSVTVQLGEDVEAEVKVTIVPAAGSTQQAAGEDE